jgi:hypothetical protein
MRTSIIILAALAALLLPGTAGAAERSDSCGAGETAAESGETGEPVCVPSEPEEEEESEEAEETEVEVVVGVEAPAAKRGYSFAPAPGTPVAMAVRGTVTAKRPICTRASATRIHSDRRLVGKLRGTRRREAERRLAHALC